MTYVNAAAAVESPSGGFTWQLPCLSIEPSCGPNGLNTVRSPDGIHFCPDGIPATAGVTGPCDEYSPGAFRFALAIMGAVTRHAYGAAGFVGRGRSLTGSSDGAPKARPNGPVAESVASFGRPLS